MITVVLPPLLGAERAAWHLVIDLAEARLPRWVLAGGLMVHLHLHEAGVTPGRVTTDVDAVVDVGVRSARATEVFAHRLRDELGMRMQEPDAHGIGHRFIRADGTVVDVLAADFGPRSRPHATIPPARTVEVPGGRALLAAAERVRIEHDGRTAIIERPSLIAAIVAKARALTEIPSPSGDPRRHLRDAGTLLSLVDPDTSPLSRTDRRHLKRLLHRIQSDPAASGRDLDLVIDTLRLLVGE